MTEYQTHAALVATLEAEVTRLRAVNAELRASISRQVQVDTTAQEPVAHDEDLLEQLYWELDSQRKKTGDERLAFKGKMRFYASEFRQRCLGKLAFCPSVSDDMMNLADRLGELPYVDPRAWKHLLVYAPQPARQPLTDEEIDEVLRYCEKIVPDKAGWVILQRRAYARAVERAHGIGGEA